MNIAVIARGFMRTYNVTKDALIKNVLSPNNADLFIYTYETCGASKIPQTVKSTVELNNYKYTREYCLQDEEGEKITYEKLQKVYGKYLKKSWIINLSQKEKDLIKNDVKNVLSIGFDLERIYTSYYITTCAISSFVSWCKEHNKIYDAVILIRPDLHIYSKISIKDFNLSNISIPDTGGNINMSGKTELYEVLSYKNVSRCEYIPYKTMYFSDQFLISSFDNIARLTTFYSALKKYENRGFPTAHPESVMFYHCAFLPKIKVDIKHIEYEILRTNYIQKQNLITATNRNLEVKSEYNKQEYTSYKKRYLEKNQIKFDNEERKIKRYRSRFMSPINKFCDWLLSPIKLTYHIIRQYFYIFQKKIFANYSDLSKFQLDYLFYDFTHLIEKVPNFALQLQKICKPNQFNLILTYHMGDVLFTAAHYHEFEKHFRHQLHFIVRPSQKVILDILNIKNYTICDFDKYIDPYISEQIDDKVTLGYVKIMIMENIFSDIPLLNIPFVVGIKNNNYLEKQLSKHKNYPINFFHEWSLCLGFDNKNIDKLLNINIPKLSVKTLKEINKIADIKKIVILAPETRSDIMFDISFWNKLAEVIHKQGYTIILNTTDKDFNINYATKVDMNFSDLIALSYECDTVFSIRSGLCDILFKKGKNLYVFYTKERWNTKRWGRNKKNYISINKIFNLKGDKKVNEIVIGEKKKIMWHGINLSDIIQHKSTKHFGKIKNKTDIDKKEVYYFLGMPIYKKYKGPNKKYLKILGITVYCRKHK